MAVSLRNDVYVIEIVLGDFDYAAVLASRPR